MNMIVLCHEYKGGCILTFIASPLSGAHSQGIVQQKQCYDLTCKDDYQKYDLREQNSNTGQDIVHVPDVISRLLSIKKQIGDLDEHRTLETTVARQ